ncbi:uncharacterized protein LOC131882366 isoform X2 [Tigriopus californicus]|uniref:uncharacterized protein LOC131882366 isoform X2 n=1 Tax=Tigriopus californicus TaxID=6832 RepID=UPI0027DA3279|nr:uncharacterized protein LOC131882366 isoform X2 [Tigriopus californicus]
MVKLTEEMIVARTRVSDMNNVKKLNCWGAELTDITVLRKLVNVEVLSLSVNCITSLSDIQNCKNLQELYIRKNKIPDLSEICWLKELSKLKSLWLEENPCVQDHGDVYRVTVIRNLPQLQKLDNLPVQSDEMADAMRRGMELVHPLDREPTVPYHNVNYQPLPTGNIERRRSQSQDPYSDYQDEGPIMHSGSRRTSAMEQNSTYTNSGMALRRGSSNQPAPPSASFKGNTSYVEDNGYVPEYHTGRRYSTQENSNPLVRRSPHNSQLALNEGLRRISMHESPAMVSNPRDESPPPVMYQERQPRNSMSSYSGPTSDAQLSSYGYQGGSYETRSGHVHENGSMNGLDGSSTPSRMVHSASTTESPTSEINHNMLTRSGSASIHPSLAKDSYSPTNNEQDEYHQQEHSAVVSQQYEQAYEQANHQLESTQTRSRSVVGRNSFSPERPYPRRPKNRNSNILSAVLCLIKELDGPSLEVAEMAIRCRMDELDD